MYKRTVRAEPLFFHHTRATRYSVDLTRTGILLDILLTPPQPTLSPHSEAIFRVETGASQSRRGTGVGTATATEVVTVHHDDDIHHGAGSGDVKAAKTQALKGADVEYSRNATNINIEDVALSGEPDSHYTVPKLTARCVVKSQKS